MLAAQIIAARVRWFHRVLGEGSPYLAPLKAWDDDGQPQRSCAELAAGLEATWALIQDCLNRWTPANLDDAVAARGETLTRQWVIWHVVEPDLHHDHGGELFFTLGMHGLTAPEL